MTEERLPSGLWVEAHLRRLDTAGISYYIVNKGAYASGTILLKLNGLSGQCRVLIQQRDIEGNLGWENAMDEELIEEAKSDDYIRRALSRDPDVWVIEIEDRAMKNPFELQIT